MSFYVTAINDNYLAHHGVKGMKLGVRRYQNKDGAYKVSQIVRDKNMSIAYEAGQKSVQRNIDMMDKLFKDAVNNKEVQSYSYKINADKIVNDHLNRARNDSLKTAFKNVYNYERSGGNYSGYVPSGALEVAWKRKR